LSIRVGGIYNIKSQNLSVKDEIKIAYKLISLSVEFEIGLHLGGNSTFQSNNNGELEYKQTPFNFSDDPLDNNAECLFVGDGIEVTIDDVRVDFEESLEKRMLKLQNFFKKALAIDFLTHFELNVNIEDGDSFETISIGVDEFKEEMIRLYEKEGNWTPIVKLIITRS
jgi:hypothetical protein